MAVAPTCVSSWAEETHPPLPIAAESRVDGEQGVLLMKSGQVLSGRLVRAADRYVLLLPDGEIRVRVMDVQMICRSLDEVYEFKRNGITSDRVEAHLDLADWCSRQDMPGHAAEELAAAMRIEPHHPRISVAQRALDQAHDQITKHEDVKRNENSRETPTVQNAIPKSAPVESENETLDRLVKGLPSGSMEAFSTTIQPILINNCTTSGCHGPRSNTTFQIERLPLERNINPRLTQRNVSAVLEQINRQSPLESPLLTVPIRPHGGLKTPVIAERQATLYQQLANWVAVVSLTETRSTPPRTIAPKIALNQTLRHYGFGPTSDEPPTDENATGGDQPTTGYVGHRPAELKRDKTSASNKGHTKPDSTSPNGKDNDAPSVPTPTVETAPAKSN
jgi:hypothetical protein